MKVFAVFKVAVYRHECGGIFSTLDAARAAALSQIIGECDDHHSYAIVPFEIDCPTQQTPVTGWRAGGDLDEPDAVLTLMRSGFDVRETPNV